MVCVPCFVIPFLLWVFHKFVGPWLNKMWGKPAEMVKNVEDNLVCPMPKKKKKVNAQENSDAIKSDPSSNGSTAVNGQPNLGERLKAE
ncbi:hypothetical protein RRG08_063907 [Elysia crispata]|uniref:Uncharacterized protein n=1 Tax=Elysia crispata TaxID=231223 RepID=A0AAE0YEE0_9GAST|nr:hypothetical protein RRG08_063907 [Elysia crispata]